MFTAAVLLRPALPRLSILCTCWLCLQVKPFGPEATAILDNLCNNFSIDVAQQVRPRYLVVLVVACRAVHPAIAAGAHWHLITAFIQVIFLMTMVTSGCCWCSACKAVFILLNYML